ncbi:MAG TPA: YncE family protein, partial [Thermoplasmata archaeon]|nr:YncE family protein [Thermoplasmata archaeon]
MPSSGPFGFSERTVDLLNGTTSPGNALPPEGWTPTALSFDPANQRLYSLSAGSPPAGNYAPPTVNVVNASSQAFVTNIPLSSLLYPVALAVDPANGLLYVAGASGQLDALNTSSNAVTANLSLGGSVSGIALNANGSKAFVAGAGNGSLGNESVSIVDLSSNTVAAQLVVGIDPTGIVDDPANGDVYVADFWDGNVSVINATNDTLVTTLSVGPYPSALAVDPTTDTIYVLGGNFSILNGTSNTLQSSSGFGYNYFNFFGSNPLLDVPSSHELFAITSGGQVGILSTRNDSWVANVTVGSSPSTLAWDSRLREVLVGNSLSANVSLISPVTNGTTGSVNVTGAPDFLAVDLTTGIFFASIQGFDRIQALNGTTGQTVAEIPVALEPHDVVVDNATGDWYVSESDGGTVQAFDANGTRLLATIATGIDPTLLTLDAADHRVYVVNQLSRTVTGIDTATDSAATTAPVGRDPDAVAWDPTDDRLYVANGADGNVSVINGSTGDVLGNVSIGSPPSGLAWDPIAGSVLAFFSGSRNVSVINTSSDLSTGNFSLGTAGPLQLAYDAASREIDVLASSPSAVEILAAANYSIVATVSLGASDFPTSISVDPETGDVLVGGITNLTNGNIEIINSTTNSVATTVGVGTNPGPILIDDPMGSAIVENDDSNNMSVVDLTNDTVVATFPGGNYQRNGAVNPSTG